MSTREIRDGENIEEALRSAVRTDSFTQDTFATPESHKRINAALQRARLRGTWATDAETGEVILEEGKPVKSKKKQE